MSAQLEKEKAINKITAAAVLAVAQKRAAEAEEAKVTEPTTEATTEEAPQKYEGGAF